MVPEKLNKVFNEDVNDGLISRFLFDWSDPLPIRPLERNTDNAAKHGMSQKGGKHAYLGCEYAQTDRDIGNDVAAAAGYLV
jgi:hypothetical protein